jgi:hypothetical protein
VKKLLLGIVFSTVAGAAGAADMSAPAYKAPPPTVVSGNGFYLSVDGAWRRVNLPNYGLGYRQLTAGLTDAGAFDSSLRQRFDGYLVRGAVGYFLPGGLSNTFFGADTRLEIGGQFGRSSGSENGTTLHTVGGVVTQTLNGTLSAGGYVCNPGPQTCTTNTNVSTTYSDWQLNGKIAGDYRLGAFVVTPSLALFGGDVRNDQTLAQVLKLGTSPNLSTYNASTALRWNDFGARAGLDVTVNVTSWATVGIGGWAGFASRRASLSGSDVSVDAILGLLNGASTISLDSRATPFLANVEAGVAIKPLPALIVRGFVGLNHDSKVPGVTAPSFTGTFPGATTPTAASISFNSETSYYAGGGLTWMFNPAL